MNPRAPFDPRLLEALSAYLDGQLAGAEKAALEDRLSREEDLRRHLAELRAVRDSLRALPPIKPPRALTLSRAQAGEPVRRFEWFSSGRLALGSALAALAFAVVFSANLFSQGLTLGAAAPMMVENFAAPAMLQATGPLPAPSASGPQEKYGGGEGATPALAPPPSEPASDGCGESSGADAAAERCGIGGGFEDLPAPQTFSLPDFQTLAPVLEALFGLSALLLGLFAIIGRRRK